MTTTSFMQIAAILLTGLLAGLFYGYDCSVILGLGKLPDKEYLQAFQSISREILNPYFFTSFMGCLLVLPMASYLSYNGVGASPSFYFLIAATIIYLVFVFAITGLGNVPLNNMLEQTDLASTSPAGIHALRSKFENKWNALHHLRTYASILVFLLAILSTLKFK